MIPLAALKAVPWRLVAYGAAIAALLVLGWRIHAWREAYKALPAAQEALQREIECGKGSECLKRAQAAQARAEAAAAVTLKGYEDEIQSLRNRPVQRRVIRVCADAGTGDVQRPGAPGSADATGTPSGLVHGAAEFYTAPLRDLARDADEIAARLRALQQWNAALATPSAGRP